VYSDPERLSHFLLDECRARGVQLHKPARATSLLRNESGKIVGVRVQHLDGNSASDMEVTTIDIYCTRIVFAAGAWTPEAFSTLFPTARLRLPISPLAGHSVVLRSPRWVSYNTNSSEDNAELPCHGVFTNDIGGFSPELFSRFGGGPTSDLTHNSDTSASKSQSKHEIYLAGLNSSALPLPVVATGSTPDEHSIARLIAVAHRLLGPDVDIIRTGLCFRPVTPWGYPIIARLDDGILGNDEDGGRDHAFEEEGGVFVAAGHGPWGIAHSLGTGKVMAELIRGEVTSADISGLGLRGM
jgi:glycine/D-amino acid oxidase-like deaminating enzyme